MDKYQLLKTELDKRFAEIQTLFNKLYPELSIWSCVHVGIELDAPDRVAYYFRESCPDFEQLKNEIKTAIEVAADNTGFKGSTFYY